MSRMRSLTLAVAVLAGAPVFAAGADVPEQVAKRIHNVVSGSEATALVRVVALPEAGQKGTARLRVEHELMMSLPSVLEMDVRHLEQADRKLGLQLFMPLKLARADRKWRWVRAGAYERVEGGSIAGLPLARFLALSTRAAEQVEAERAERSEARSRAARAAKKAPVETANAIPPETVSSQPKLASGI